MKSVDLTFYYLCELQSLKFVKEREKIKRNWKVDQKIRFFCKRWNGVTSHLKKPADGWIVCGRWNAAPRVLRIGC